MFGMMQSAAGAVISNGKWNFVFFLPGTVLLEYLYSYSVLLLSICMCNVYTSTFISTYGT